MQKAKTFDITKEWCRKLGAEEDGLDIGAGILAQDPQVFTQVISSVPKAPLDPNQPSGPESAA